MPSPRFAFLARIITLTVALIIAVESESTSAKYFREPGGSLSLGHYDSRFFQHEVSYDQHRFVLHHLIRSYLSAMNDRGIETWLAHGTLLGWWWNGRIMPWDYDLDVQVSNFTLYRMADSLNRTEHSYNYTDPAGKVVSNRYMLDVNPHHGDLNRGDGMNIIDARWIDMGTGMFVDITGVRQRDPNWPGVWSCKNAHRYSNHELWPMRISQFEGVKARIPYSFEKILSKEYGPKCLVTEEHLGHRWDRRTKEWIKLTDEGQNQLKQEARERKRLQLVADGKLPF